MGAPIKMAEEESVVSEKPMGNESPTKKLPRVQCVHANVVVFGLTLNPKWVREVVTDMDCSFLETDVLLLAGCWAAGTNHH